MTDDPNARGPQDRSRVNVEQEYERRYWAEKWSVSEDELRQAVEKVGPMAADVARELGKSL